MNPARLSLLGFGIILTGFVVVAVGAFQGGSSSGGGFILIGPVPIVFGGGPDSGALVELGVILTAAAILLYLVPFLAWRWKRREADAETESE